MLMMVADQLAKVQMYLFDKGWDDLGNRMQDVRSWIMGRK